MPWERLAVPYEGDGSQGMLRELPSTCTLSANNYYEAVQAWLALHESAATQRAYRKEAERLILWANIERGRAHSSLTTEDAVAYRAFLRHPTPGGRWEDRRGRGPPACAGSGLGTLTASLVSTRAQVSFVPDVAVGVAASGRSAASRRHFRVCGVCCCKQVLVAGGEGDRAITQVHAWGSYVKNPPRLVPGKSNTFSSYGLALEEINCEPKEAQSLQANWYDASGNGAGWRGVPCPDCWWINSLSFLSHGTGLLGGRRADRGDDRCSFRRRGHRLSQAEQTWPWAYIRDVLRQLPLRLNSRLDELLPHHRVSAEG